MSDNKLVKSLLDAATITGLVAGIGWIGKKVIKEKPHWRPQHKLDELRQVHSRHGGQHRAEQIPGGPKNPPRQPVSAHLPNLGVCQPYIYATPQWPRSQ